MKQILGETAIFNKPSIFSGFQKSMRYVLKFDEANFCLWPTLTEYQHIAMDLKHMFTLQNPCSAEYASIIANRLIFNQSSKLIKRMVQSYNFWIYIIFIAITRILRPA